jgi:hypothetical protein
VFDRPNYLFDLNSDGKFVIVINCLFDLNSDAKNVVSVKDII